MIPDTKDRIVSSESWPLPSWSFEFKVGGGVGNIVATECDVYWDP